MAALLSWVVDKQSQSTDAVSLDLVERCLKGLDGLTFTYMRVDFDDHAFMTIGGGPDRYLVGIERWDPANGDEQILTVANPAAGIGSTLIVLGGQDGWVPDRYLVNQATALRAATEFVQSGSAADDLTWDVQ